MTPQERILAYLHLRGHGYSADETIKIIEEIKEKMEKDKS